MTPVQPAAAGSGDGLALSTWKLMIDGGSMQDGDKHLAATARPAVARVRPATYAALGLADGAAGTVTGDRGSVTMPVEVVDDMTDGINPGGYRDRDLAAADASKTDKEGVIKLIRQLKKMQKPPPKDKDKSKARTAKGTTDRGSALTRSATGPAATASSSPQPRNARNTSSPTTGKADNRRDNPATPADTEAASHDQSPTQTSPTLTLTLTPTLTLTLTVVPFY
jgi:hypothetical protein